MPFDEMILAGPVYVHRHDGQYRCVWTPMRDKVMLCHAIGVADSPYRAMGRAQAHARAQGWVQD